jgi:hypothetical protein
MLYGAKWYTDEVVIYYLVPRYTDTVYDLIIQAGLSNHGYASSFSFYELRESYL